MSDNLKPCPFCGGSNVQLCDPPWPISVTCEDCWADGPCRDDIGEAIVAWNARVIPEPPEAA